MGLLSGLISAARTTLRLRAPTAASTETAQAAVGRWAAVKEWSDERIAIARKRFAEIQRKVEIEAKKIDKQISYENTFHDQMRAYFAESSTERGMLMRYAWDRKLSPGEILFQDAEKERIWTRKDFRRLRRRGSGVAITITDIWIDQINKRSLKANNGYFKKFIFPTTLQDRLTEVRYLLSTADYLRPEGKVVDANKCDLWCIPILSPQHISAIVINIKEARFEYLDSSFVDRRKYFQGMGDLPDRIVAPVTRYINIMRAISGGDVIDFSKFEWTFPPVPYQPPRSNACAIYTLRFMEEWDVGDGMDLSRFEGWEEESWHIKERAKLCASLLTDDSNVILDKVKRRAKERELERHAIRKAKQTVSLFLLGIAMGWGGASISTLVHVSGMVSVH